MVLTMAAMQEARAVGGPGAGAPDRRDDGRVRDSASWLGPLTVSAAAADGWHAERAVSRSAAALLVLGTLLLRRSRQAGLAMPCSTRRTTP